MKFFNTQQIREIDKYTIENEPIASIDLMERASEAIFQYIKNSIKPDRAIYVFAGPGNNGGDGLALARKLLEYGYETSVFYIGSANLSPDCEINLKRIKKLFPDNIIAIKNKIPLLNIEKNALIIDALFGSGLTRKLSGIYAEIVDFINQNSNFVLAVDIPSGLNGEENTDYSAPIVKANLTLSLHFPKLAFFLPENETYIGNWEILPISLHPKIIEKTETKYNYIHKNDVSALLKTRNKFSHKGNFGHSFVFAGKKGMAGAAILNAEAALRSGAGLLSVCSSKSNRIILQTAVPEAIFVSKSEKSFDLKNYNAYALGSGIGRTKKTVDFFEKILIGINHNCVIDADGLNILSENRYLIEKLPEKCILTPHLKEFERLFGKCENSYERMKKAQKLSADLNVYIVLKGAHSLIACPEGDLYFNTSGNPGMATAGSGDVLTGIISALLSQGYSPKNAAIIGVFIHGLAGDCALKKSSPESLIARDIIENLSQAFELLKSS